MLRLSTHALAIILTLGCVAIPGVVADLNDGLVSWWSFDGNTRDGGPAGNHGTRVGGPTFDAGQHGDALLFNGVDQYVTIPDDPSLQIPGDITVCAWINVNVGVDHAGICWKGQGIGWGPRFSWRIATTTDTTITWGRTNGDPPDFAGDEFWFATDDVYTTGEWVHVALTSSSTDAQHAYVNGEDITDVTGQTDNAAALGPFGTFPGFPVEIGVGRRVGGTDGNDMFYDGLIDEVGIYNRTLSADEIVDLAAGDMPTAVEARGKLSTTWADIKSVR